MMKIHILPLGDYQTNCYIVYDENASSCAILDPGYHPEKVLAKVKELGLTVDAVLLTHGHFDHVGAVEKIVTETGCALWMSEGDWSQFPNPIISHYYPLANCDFTEVQFCEDGEVIRAGGLEFKTVATPGHTHGSVCYICQDALFSGDTLFAGSCGRTDLPGGDIRQLKKSLARLARLEKPCFIHAGHGGGSYLGKEKQDNPYLRGGLL